MTEHIGGGDHFFVPAETGCVPEHIGGDRRSTDFTSTPAETGCAAEHRDGDVGVTLVVRPIGWRREYEIIATRVDAFPRADAFGLISLSR